MLNFMGDLEATVPDTSSHVGLDLFQLLNLIHLVFDLSLLLAQFHQILSLVEDRLAETTIGRRLSPMSLGYLSFQISEPLLLGVANLSFNPGALFLRLQSFPFPLLVKYIDRVPPTDLLLPLCLHLR